MRVYSNTMERTNLRHLRRDGEQRHVAALGGARIGRAREQLDAQMNRIQVGPAVRRRANNEQRSERAPRATAPHAQTYCLKSKTNAVKPTKSHRPVHTVS